VTYGDLERLATQMSGMSCIVLAVLHKFVVTMTKQCADDLAGVGLVWSPRACYFCGWFHGFGPNFAEYG